MFWFKCPIDDKINSIYHPRWLSYLKLLHLILLSLPLFKKKEILKGHSLKFPLMPNCFGESLNVYLPSNELFFFSNIDVKDKLIYLFHFYFMRYFISNIREKCFILWQFYLFWWVDSWFFIFKKDVFLYISSIHFWRKITVCVLFLPADSLYW